MREQLTLQPGETCYSCGGKLVEATRTRTYEFQGRSVDVPMHGLWCTAPGCGCGLVNLRDMDLLQKAMELAAPTSEL